MQALPSDAARQREDLRAIAADAIDVIDVRPMPPEERGIIKLSGRLRLDAATAYAWVAPRFRAHGYTALFQEEDDHVAIVAVPGLLLAQRSRLWLALLLFGLTVASTVFVGGLQVDGFNLGLGLAFSASILSILLAHELGHFLTARRLGVAVSYPFFIPMPITFIGTMGAFIAMKAPPPDRRALLSIAIAGPIAGLIVAIPVLLLGLSLSEVRLIDEMFRETGGGGFQEGNSLLYAAAKILVFGRFLPNGVEDVYLHPVALAGWVGLLITGLNLIPAGQLDGGHIFYALMGGRAARLTTWAIAGVLALLGFFWIGWVLWSLLVLLLGQQRAPLLNELTPLDARQRALALLGLVLFVLVFTPIPLMPIGPGS